MLRDNYHQDQAASIKVRSANATTRSYVSPEPRASRPVARFRNLFFRFAATTRNAVKITGARGAGALPSRKTIPGAEETEGADRRKRPGPSRGPESSEAANGLRTHEGRE